MKALAVALLVAGFIGLLEWLAVAPKFREWKRRRDAEADNADANCARHKEMHPGMWTGGKRS